MATALATSGDRVLAVGDPDELLARWPGARTLDLDGATVVPGLTDAHLHVVWTGLKLLRLLGPGEHEVEESLAALQDAAFAEPWPGEAPTVGQRMDAIRLAQRLAHGLGLTGAIDPAVDRVDLAAYRALRAKGELTLRIVAMPHVRPARRVDDALADLGRLGRSGDGDDLLRLGAAKIYVDGQGRAGTALRRRPWPGGEDHGTQLVPTEDLRAFAVGAAARGWAVGAHVVGGGGIGLVLDAYAAAGPLPRDRWQLIHAYLEPSAEDLRLAAELEVVAAVQPSIQWANGAALVARLGDAAAESAPLRAWREAGVTLAGGSDGPDFPLDPRLGLWQARTRHVEGRSDPLGATQALDGQAALELWTTGAAAASFAAGRRGSLRPGALADWTAWSVDPVEDPPEALLRATALRTAVGGRLVSCAEVPTR